MCMHVYLSCTSTVIFVRICVGISVYSMCVCYSFVVQYSFVYSVCGVVYAYTICMFALPRVNMCVRLCLCVDVSVCVY